MNSDNNMNELRDKLALYFAKNLLNAEIIVDDPCFPAGKIATTIQFVKINVSGLNDPRIMMHVGTACRGTYSGELKVADCTQFKKMMLAGTVDDHCRVWHDCSIYDMLDANNLTF